MELQQEYSSKSGDVTTTSSTYARNTDVVATIHNKQDLKENVYRHIHYAQSLTQFLTIPDTYAHNFININ